MVTCYHVGRDYKCSSKLDNIDDDSIVLDCSDSCPISKTYLNAVSKYALNYKTEQFSQLKERLNGLIRKHKKVD